MPADAPPVQAPLARATSSKAPLHPAYKQHTAVDDLAGVVVDIEIVTGEEHDTGRINERLDAIEVTLGITPGRITADTIYGVGRVFAALEDRRIEAVIPPLRSPRAPRGRRGSPPSVSSMIPKTTWPDVRRRSGCPPATARNPVSGIAPTDAIACPAPSRCNAHSGAPPSRRVHVVTNHAAILRARRKRATWGDDEHAIYTRHRWRIEGAHGTAKTLHGLAKAIRGLENMKIQALLTAVAMDLKKLAADVQFIWSIFGNRPVTPIPASA